jgi:hypothetical protein
LLGALAIWREKRGGKEEVRREKRTEERIHRQSLARIMTLDAYCVKNVMMHANAVAFMSTRHTLILL